MFLRGFDEGLLIMQAILEIGMPLGFSFYIAEKGNVLSLYRACQNWFGHRCVAGVRQLLLHRIIGDIGLLEKFRGTRLASPLARPPCPTPDHLVFEMGSGMLNDGLYESRCGFSSGKSFGTFAQRRLGAGLRAVGNGQSWL